MPIAKHPLNEEIQTLYLDHHGWLQGWLRRRLGDTGKAADLAHDTFVRLLACDPAVAALRVSGTYTLAEPEAVIRALLASLPVQARYRTRYWLTIEARPEEK